MKHISFFFVLLLSITSYAQHVMKVELTNGAIRQYSVANVARVLFEDSKTSLIDNPVLEERKRSLKILHVGNSYTLDACGYVHKLLEDIDLDVTIGIVYYGGASLKKYQEELIPNDTCSFYYKYTKEVGDWVRNKTYAISDALADEEWDMLVFQQASNKCDDYSTYEPYLTDVIHTLTGMMQKPVEVGFLLTTPRSKDNGVTCFEGQAIAAQNVLDNSECTFVIPCGTAVQNVRTTIAPEDFLDYGEDPDVCMMNNNHLQVGLGLLAEGYAYVAWLCQRMGVPARIIGSKYRPVLGDEISPHGSEVKGVTEATCVTAQKAAVMAVKKPFVITQP